MERCNLVLIFLLLISGAWAQAQDSLKTKQLNELVIKSYRLPGSVSRLPKSGNGYIWQGKKSEVIQLTGINANIAEKTARQIFAKVPGVFVYDMDGTGNQINISTRGLDPHRGWEFNIRKNGVITNSDMYGYPASHYSMPLESVERIELVRGTGSLQYGAQFGGMLNYVTKSGDTTRTIGFESVNSIGSFGLVSTYQGIGGKAGRFRYYAYYYKRNSNGYRANSRTEAEAQAIMVAYKASKNISINLELARSAYVYQIPGPLTDSMFHADPRQATRSRNFFNPDIYVPSIQLDWRMSDRTRFIWIVSSVLGYRNSVMFDKPATMADVIDSTSLRYAPRQVDIDQFNSYTSELKLIHEYNWLNGRHLLASGMQVFNNDLHRRQLGRGTTGTDFNLSVDDAGFARNLHFRSKNIALYVENKFQVSKRLNITPGFRLESGESVMSGTISYYEPGNLPRKIPHQFPLLGVSANYSFNNEQNLYAGITQSYRPVIFKDIIPASTYEQVDKNLRDADGFTAELGYRGAKGKWQWDVSVFELHYNNRLGMLAMDNGQGSFYIFRTNIGNSITRGAEIFAEYLITSAKTNFAIFTSTGIFRGRYAEAYVRVGDDNISVKGNHIESVPDIISRNGITLQHGIASVTGLFSYTARSYADALNSIQPSPTGSVGLVPSYSLIDINMCFQIVQQLEVKVNVNNVCNKSYFTKRPQFYPGPGIWPSDGRSWSVTLSLKL